MKKKYWFKINLVYTDAEIGGNTLRTWPNTYLFQQLGVFSLTVNKWSAIQGSYLNPQFYLIEEDNLWQIKKLCSIPSEMKNATITHISAIHEVDYSYVQKLLKKA